MRKQGARISEIVMENGEVYGGKMFADCTYEGDLMAQAKVSYTWGRESTEQYGEPLAGVRDRTPEHQFEVDIPARGAGRPVAARDFIRAEGRIGHGGQARAGLQLPHHRHQQPGQSHGLAEPARLRSGPL